MKHSNEEREDLLALIFAELKGLGVKVPKIKKYKFAIGKQEKNPAESKQKAKIFGISLSEQEWISENGCTIPKFLAMSTSYLEAYTQVEIGLFRKAGSVARQRDLRTKLEAGGNFDGSEPNDVASLLKQWLRELPEPVIPLYLHDLFVRCRAVEAADVCLIAVLLSCLLLPAEHLFTLKHLVIFLSEIAANSEVNKMVPHNLAVIMAPNLLSSNCDPASCKLGNNLVHCYTSLVELLILNAEKIGQIPSGISQKLSLKLEDFDFSIEAIDCSPSKSKRKRRSGGVIDIMSGIRKLVGGNLTPVDNFLELPDILVPSIKVNSTLPSETRSALKRKADHIYPLNDVIKKNALPDSKPMELSETPLLTPIGKTARFVNSLATPITGLTPGIRNNRRKSFGLLKRKQQKKAKLLMKSSESAKQIDHLLSVQCNSLSEDTSDKDHEVQNKHKMMDTITVPNVINMSSMIITYKSSPFLRVENPVIKRSQSDCIMNSPKSELINVHKFISTSHEDLPKKRLSSNRLNCNLTTKHHSPRKYNSYDKSSARGIRHVSSRKKSTRGKHDSKHKVSEKDSVKGENSTTNTSNEFCISNETKVNSINISESNVKLACISSIPTGKLSLSESNSVLLPEKNLKNEEKPSRKNTTGLNSNMKCHSNVEMLFEFKTPDSKVKKLPEVNKLKRSSPSAKGSKKGANKSSLKRGRPNTVKTGLPSDLCPKYSVDSISTFKSDAVGKLTDCKYSNQKANAETVLNEEFSLIEDNVFDDVNIKKSLNNEIEACVKEIEKCNNPCNVSTNAWLNLTPLENKQCDISMSFTDTFSQETETLDLNTNKIQSVDIEKKFNQKNIFDNLYINNGPKNLYETYSSGSLFDENMSKEHISSIDETILKPLPSKENVNVIVNQSESVVIQTAEKENEDTWMNAEKYFKTHLQPITPIDNPAACKRESIMQLMVRNAGKVQENVQHYNCISFGSTPHKSDQIPNLISASCNNSDSSSSSLIDENLLISENTVDQHSDKNDDHFSKEKIQNLQICESSLTCSESKTCKVEKKKAHKLMLQYSPRCINKSTDFFQNRGSPLKELTNTSTLKENLNNKKSSDTHSPFEVSNGTPLNNKRPITYCTPLNDDVSLSHTKHHSRNSSPSSKSVKMRIRCDSSPMLNKLPQFNSQGSDFSSKSSGAVMRSLQGHSQSFSSTRFHKKKSVSTIPRHSMSNVMLNCSNQLYDEWECDM